MFSNNRNRFFKCINDNSIALFYSGHSHYKSGDQLFPFEVNKNFYYLTGIQQDGSILILIKKSSMQKTFLFIPNINPIHKLWNDDQLNKEQITNISKISCNNIYEMKDFNVWLNQQICEFKSLSPKVYFDIPYYHKKYYCWGYEQIYKFLSSWPWIEIANSSPILLNLRKQKNNEEINYIKHAIDIHYHSLIYTFNNLKKCQYEFEISAHFHYFLEMQK
ncbi:MAG: aminopeptidase P N-terminal domain-containing protein, partial [Candidatus Phytoplasma australasiaticum]|nr:aminopeptidase P N-terminal domain-containing protein [Candidatus Phytoplasma australasiaticum]